jgi:acetyl-CoA acetyltransferase
MRSNPRSAVIVEAVRTPIGRGHPEKGYYRDVHANELLGACYRAVIDRAGIDAEAGRPERGRGSLSPRALRRNYAPLTTVRSSTVRRLGLAAWGAAMRSSAFASRHAGHVAYTRATLARPGVPPALAIN